MQDILDQISGSLSDIFKSDIVQFGIRAIGLYLVIIWLATAYWAFRDMQQRSDNAILPYVAAAGIILFTPIFFVFAVLDLQDRPAAREDRRGLGAQPGRGGPPRRGRIDPPLPVLRAAHRR